MVADPWVRLLVTQVTLVLLSVGYVSLFFWVYEQEGRQGKDPGAWGFSGEVIKGRDQSMRAWTPNSSSLKWPHSFVACLWNIFRRFF